MQAWFRLLLHGFLLAHHVQTIQSPATAGDVKQHEGASLRSIDADSIDEKALQEAQLGELSTEEAEHSKKSQWGGLVYGGGVNVGRGGRGAFTRDIVLDYYYYYYNFGFYYGYYGAFPGAGSPRSRAYAPRRWRGVGRPGIVGGGPGPVGGPGWRGRAWMRSSLLDNHQTESARYAADKPMVPAQLAAYIKQMENMPYWDMLEEALKKILLPLSPSSGQLSKKSVGAAVNKTVEAKATNASAPASEVQDEAAKARANVDSKMWGYGGPYWGRGWGGFFYGYYWQPQRSRFMGWGSRRSAVQQMLQYLNQANITNREDINRLDITGIWQARQAKQAEYKQAWEEQRNKTLAQRGLMMQKWKEYQVEKRKYQLQLLASRQTGPRLKLLNTFKRILAGSVPQASEPSILPPTPAPQELRDENTDADDQNGVNNGSPPPAPAMFENVP